MNIHKNKTTSILLLLFALCILGSCKKLLDEKPKSGLQIPNTLKDFQALLDAYVIINRSDPCTGELSSDDYYLTDATLNARTAEERAAYTWQHSNVFIPINNDWANIYKIVYRSNTVLEGIDKISQNSSNQQEWNNVKGQAAYLRGKAFLQGLAIWSLAYDANSSQSDLGLALRLGTDFNVASVRTSAAAGYQQCIDDLKLAIALLPDQPLHVVRASKPAAYGLLARTYLYMRNYDLALLYADSCLALKSDLLDYNTVSSTPSYPIPQFNTEVIYDSYMSTPTPLSNSYARITPELYAQYETSDLRQTLFFKLVEPNVYGYRGSYVKSYQLFTGLATDEVYLMRAECNARKGNVLKANQDLNALLKKRYKTGTFTDLNIISPTELLSKILLERRKELLMRGLRWMDIKRLNKEGYNIGLKRMYNTGDYSMAPNARGFALPLPEDIISISGMEQNSY